MLVGEDIVLIKTIPLKLSQGLCVMGCLGWSSVPPSNPQNAVLCTGIWKGAVTHHSFVCFVTCWAALAQHQSCLQHSAPHQAGGGQVLGRGHNYNS